MGFEVSDRAKEINERLEAFMEEYISVSYTHLRAHET